MADPRHRAVVIIPARLGSTRFPNKVLADKTGSPMIRHVYDAARRATAAARVVIATDDARVMAAAKGFAAECVMTSPEHPNGTSRLAEAARLLGLGASDIVVNVQGDEPELEPSVVDEAVAALVSSGAPVATVAVPFGSGEEPANPNIVKVVRRVDGRALYFSRAWIPYPRESGAAGNVAPLRHIGIYVYRRSFLDVYLTLPVTDLERTEQLEQLRVLAHGHDIAVAVCRSAGGPGIDTPEQYEAFVKRWRAGR